MLPMREVLGEAQWPIRSRIHFMSHALHTALQVLVAFLSLPILIWPELWPTVPISTRTIRTTTRFCDAVTSVGRLC